MKKLPIVKVKKYNIVLKKPIKYDVVLKGPGKIKQVNPRNIA